MQCCVWVIVCIVVVLISRIIMIGVSLMCWVVDACFLHLSARCLWSDLQRKRVRSVLITNSSVCDDLFVCKLYNTQWIVTTLMVTSTVQHVKQTRPLWRPLNKTRARTLANEATRQTTDATKVLRATSFRRDALQPTLTPAPSFIRGLIKKMVM